MRRGGMGWDLPPGVTHRMIEDAAGGDATCDVCCRPADDCDCPECRQCGVAGDPLCYAQHGMTLTRAQLSGQVATILGMAEDEIREDRDFLDRCYETDPSAEGYVADDDATTTLLAIFARHAPTIQGLASRIVAIQRNAPRDERISEKAALEILRREDAAVGEIQWRGRTIAAWGERVLVYSQLFLDVWKLLEREGIRNDGKTGLVATLEMALSERSRNP